MAHWCLTSECCFGVNLVVSVWLVRSLPVIDRLHPSGDDLILETFDSLDYRTPIDAADNDDKNAMGNESLTLDVNRDEQIYFRVSTYDEAADYVISAGMVGTRRVPAE